AQKYVPLVSNQVPYSMARRDIEKAVIPYCLEHNLSILAYSPIERGLLSGKIKVGHKFSEGDHRADLFVFREDNLVRVHQLLDKLRPLAEEKKCTLAQLVLR